jgi:alpha-L-fucosidase 2
VNSILYLARRQIVNSPALSLNYTMKSFSQYTLLLYFSFAVSYSTHAQQPLQLWYKQPASTWTEALPIGNGRIGGMIYGDARREHIQFNEETLWTGRPREFARPGAVQYLQPIRQLLAEGKQAEAEALAEKHFMGLKDPTDSGYVIQKETWFKNVRANEGPAASNFDDKGWKEMTIPTPDGYERTGLQGLDGALWFRNYFELPAAWTGKNLVLDLGRIREMDFTYVNGKLIGSDEGISKKRRYTIPAAALQTGTNSIAIQVINYFDKGGLIGVKGNDKTLIVYPEGDQASAIALPNTWKYFIQNDNPPAFPRYEADYQPFGDVYLQFPGQDAISNYRRQLDITNAIAAVSYSVGNINYTREYFVSAPHRSMVMHVQADKTGAVTVQALLNTPHRKYTVRKIDDHTIALALQVSNGVLKGESWLYVDAKGGTVAVNDSSINVQQANEVTFYLVAATSYKNYKDASADPEMLCKQVVQKVKGQLYASVKDAHIKDYKKYYTTFSITIPEGKNATLPTNERIRQFNMQDDPGLTTLYLQYGRYLLIAASRPGTQPANLQGIWNDLLTPPWGSKYTTNINLEMNYWPAEVLNLSTCTQPLFQCIEELSVAGQRTAREHYNAPGWVLHHNTDLWRGTAPINASNHGIWQTGAAWLCLHVWEHFLFTQDTAFLRKQYPVLKAAAEFFVHTLVKDPKSGYLISTPSNSPEQGGLVAGPTMDHQIIRELFRYTIQAAAILKTDPAFVKTLKEKIPQIAPNKIGKHGQLQEWMEDVDEPRNQHRHISHLWGVFPGTDITWKDTGMMKAARQSLVHRGDGGTGWSLAWKVNVWARFKDGDHALLILKNLLEPAVTESGGERGGVYYNLFDAHPPFQIDGNFGGAAGIAEMLVQSHTGVIELLPALPSELPEGEVRGLCARGGFVIDMKWADRRLVQVKVLSKAGTPLRLRHGAQQIELATKKGGVYSFNGFLKRQ